MTEVKEIRIAGFRGIKACLRLNFSKGKSIRSAMVIYGRNGTGKSSITDAWEWLQTEQIEHLRREGAGRSSYPHRNAGDGGTFIEIDFVKDELGSVKLEYDFSRITKPKATGNIDDFRLLAPHPCFIRFEDLTRFVFLTKTEKFDALARLMGFMPQVEMQKSFKRVLRGLYDEVESISEKLRDVEERLQDTLNVEELSDGRFLAEMNKLLATNKISQAEAISELGQKGIKLNDLVVNDPRARALAHFGTIRSIVNEPQIDDTCYRQIEAFLTSVVDFLKAEQEFSKLLLLELYEHGEKVVSQVDENGTPLFSAHTDSGDLVDLCPLCGQTFHGNLKEHITDELENLRKLKETRDELERRRENLLEMLPQKGMFSLSFDQLGDKFSIYDEKLTLSNVQLASSRAEKYIQELRSYLTRRVDRQTHDSIEDIEVVFDKFKDGIKVFKELRGQLHEAIRNGEI